MSENSASGASSAADPDDDELPPSHARTLPAPAAPPVQAEAPAPAPAPLPRPDGSTGPVGPESAAHPYATPYANPYAGRYQPPATAPAPTHSTDPHQQRPGLLRLVGLGGAGPSGPEQARLARLRTPAPRPYRISVTSIKGGVGKTTTSAMLGLTFARHRADRTVVIDANPHAGTLADRLLGERIMPTVRDLVIAERHRRGIDGQGLTDPLHIRQYLGETDRLMVAASEQSPDISELFDEDQYRTAQSVLTRAFDIVVTDSGTGMKHSAMKGTLATTDRLIVVAAPRYDAARRAAKTLDEVYAQGYPHLVRDAVVVITMDAPKAVGINMNTLVEYFQQLCTHVVRVPYDQHLYAGGTIRYDQVSARTRGAYMDLAALLAEGFATAAPGG